MDQKRTVPGSKLLRRRTDTVIFERIAPPAAFMSHLIVGQQTRQAAEAAGVYLRSANAAVRRLPPGYRSARVA